MVSADSDSVDRKSGTAGSLGTAARAGAGRLLIGSSLLGLGSVAAVNLLGRVPLVGGKSQPQSARVRRFIGAAFVALPVAAAAVALALKTRFPKRILQAVMVTAIVISGEEKEGGLVGVGGAGPARRAPADPRSPPPLSP